MASADVYNASGQTVAPGAGRHARSARADDPRGWGAPTIYDSAGAAPASTVGLNSHESQAPRRSSSYVPGLDGMRAIAVSAVVVYHLGAGWLPGGFLGVDVFFVLSGFLITSLLVQEWDRTHRVDIRRFYLRRARRLLPALYLMMATVVFLTAAIVPSQMSRLRGDVVSALFYVTNWTQILWSRSYFNALGPPSLLEHLWSLAVEEQFYLVWPIILVACLASRRRWLPLVVTTAGIIASTLLMAALYTPGEDPSRVYYGSDTHAAPLLIGAAFALIHIRRAGVRPGRRRTSTVAPTVALADVLALLGAGVLAYYMFEVGYLRPGLYRGGYLVVGLATVLVIHGVMSSATVTARALGTPVLRWIGVRSYGIYLWHWPIIQLTRPELHPPVSGFALDVLRVGLSVGAAAISYRYLEHPIRTQGLAAFLRGGRQRLSGARPLVAVGIAFAIVIAGAVQLSRAPSGSAAGIQYDSHATPTISISLPPPAPSPSKPSPSASASAPVPTPSASATPAAPKPAPPPAMPPFAAPVRVGFFGDSQGMTLLLNKPAGLEQYLTLTDDTIEGCGFLGGTTSSVSGQSRNLSSDCGGWQPTWAANVARDKPQIAVIEIGAWDVFDLDVNGTKMPFGSPAWDQYYNSQLNLAIKTLTGAGAQVALLSVPCYQPISAGGLQALPERGDRNRTAHLNTLLTAAAHANPQRVFMVASPTQFCSDPNVVGNTAYRWDGTHFYKPGAALEFQVITPELLKIPQPPR